MEEKKRQTGIDVVGAVPWGTHLCLFYEAKQDLLDILVPYFKVGLENNEFCIWVVSEPLSEKETKEVMSKAVPDFAQYLKKGQIEIVPHSEWYLKDGVFNGQMVLNAWINKINQPLVKGYDGLRVTGDMTWLGKENWGNFIEYEEEINSKIGDYRMLAMCTYSLGELGASEIIDVTSNHQFALVKRAGKWILAEGSEHKRAEYEIVKSEENYRSLFANMLNGFAYCKILTDENNQPIDFIYLEINDAFERLTGLKREDVIGKKVTEAIPGTRELHPELFSIYGKVALTGEPTKFDIYFKPLKIGLTISVYSPQRGYFIAVFENITEGKQAKENQETTVAATLERRLTLLQERFVRSGLADFSDKKIIELLLSLVLSSKESRKLAKECYAKFKDFSGFLAASPQELERIGIAPQCMFYIKLLHELPIEVLKQKIIEQPFYQSSQEVFDYLYYSMRDLNKEVFKAIYLNSRNQITRTEDLFEGTLKSIPIRPREIIESVIKHSAAAVIFVHNHPSGDPTPSKSDKQFTRDLVFMGSIIEVKMLDHIIIGGNRYFSFADEGLVAKYEDSFLNLRIRGVFDSRTGHR